MTELCEKDWERCRRAAVNAQRKLLDGLSDEVLETIIRWDQEHNNHPNTIQDACVYVAATVAGIELANRKLKHWDN